MERVRLGDGVAIYRRGRTWYMDWYFGGHRRRSSLKTRDKWDAILQAAREQKKRMVHHWTNGHPELARDPKILRLELALQNPHTFLPALGEAVLELLHQQESKADVPAVTWADAMREYEQHLRTGGGSEAYVRLVLNRLRHFIEFIKTETVAEVTPKHLDDYMASRAADAPKTRKQKVVELRSFFVWAKKRKMIGENPAEDLKAPKVPAREIDFYDAEEIRQLLDRIRGHKLEPIVQVALWTGLRRTELRALRGEDISLTARKIVILSPKTNVRREVPILDQALPTFEKLPTSGPVFPPRNWGEVSRTLCSMGISLAKLRRTFVTHARLNGVAPHVVAKWAGHGVQVEDAHYAGYRLGARPLEMTFGGRPLAPHGV
ncbi:MAG TPA: tyrosine-type recombinase/integrase [Planctomycetota bacterium]|nr:tyrosine-type recombinase/integrase [Planctomycetota bacterium]